MAITFTGTTRHTKTLVSPSNGTADKVYGADYVSLTSHTTTIAASRCYGWAGGVCRLPGEQPLTTNLTYNKRAEPQVAGWERWDDERWIDLCDLHVSGYGAIWSANVAPGILTHSLAANRLPASIKRPGAVGAGLCSGCQQRRQGFFSVHC